MIRSIHLSDDFDSIYSCWNKAAHFDQLPEHVFRDKLADEGFQGSCSAIFEVDRTARGFAIGVVREKNGETVGHVKFLAVLEPYRRKGVGTQLMNAVLAGFQKEGISTIRIAEAAPNYMTPGLDARYTAALFLFERLGFERIGEAYNMETHLPSEGFTQPAPAGFVFRRARRDDADSLVELLSTEWAGWIPEVKLALSRNRVAVHVAIHEGRIVAFSAYEGNNAGLGVFGPMGTKPKSRGRGLGEYLLKCCLNDMRELGYSTAIIPWVAPVGFYSRTVNASISRVFTRLERRV